MILELFIKLFKHSLVSTIRNYSQKLFFLVCSIFFAIILQAQNAKIESLLKALPPAKDTQRVSILNDLSAAYVKIKSSESLALARSYAEEALLLSKSNKFYKGVGTAQYNLGTIILNSDEAMKQAKALQYFLAALDNFRHSIANDKIPLCMRSVGFCYHHMGALDKAIQYTDSAKRLYLQLKDTISSINCLTFEGHFYFELGNLKNAYALGIDAWKQAQNTNDTLCRINALTHLANLFLGAGLPATTLDYYNKIIAYKPSVFQHKPIKHGELIWSLIIAGEAYLQLKQFDDALNLVQYLPPDNTDSEFNLFLGHIAVWQRQHEKALSYYKRGLQLDYQKGLEISCSRYANEIARTYLFLEKFDSAKLYATKALSIAELGNALLEKKNAVETLSDLYVQTKNYEQVYHYSQWYKKLHDSLAPEEYRQKMALVQIQNELENQKQRGLLLTQQNKIKEQQLSKEALLKKFLLGGAGLLLLFVGFVVRNNRHKTRTNLLLQQQKEEIQKALNQLKSTQAQLIQSEKMASLGELTAGVAHEIQNPLNFVNNFSEINTELLVELNEQLAIGNMQLAKELSQNIKENEEKISHHGKRADAIVKGMLQHSRSSIGLKEPTDINQLVVEYIRLTYHGLRAKDKSFNATIKTQFDPGLNKVNVVPQDIGRVILNLLSNAFYAVNERLRQAQPDKADVTLSLSKGQSLSKGYEPTVCIATRNVADNVEIKVIDNGNGIPEKVLDKIFQPFFTTKPTGQGTGLGLSLSYDIVKAHGGKLTVETETGKGSAFIIHLPINS